VPILYLHKVAPVAATRWWVTPDALAQLLLDLRGKRVTYLDEYDPHDPNAYVITFDGLYRNVLTYALPLLRRHGVPFECFLSGDHIGRDNAFDAPEPPADFADLDDLRTIVEHGGRLQWHSASHADLTTLDHDAIRHELAVPEHLRALDPQGFRWFAYPHGRVAGLALLPESGFLGAVACENGDDHRYTLRRDCALETTRLGHPTVALIVANYQYGRYLGEALDSALAQTQAPDELVVMDDASTDETMQVLERYAGRVTVHRNERNLGVVGNFRRGVDATASEFVCFLGADNRARADYVERCAGALIAHPFAAIAYTDMVLFGERAHILAGKVGAAKLPDVGLYHWTFPDFDASIRVRMQSHNVMHGSSAYRRSAYLEVGGYRDTGGPEDHDLFRRIVAAGHDAVRVPHPLIEYRQHSPNQANAKHGG